MFLPGLPLQVCPEFCGQSDVQQQGLMARGVVVTALG